MTDDLHINQAEMRALLDDPSGPVVGDLRKSAKRVERGAKRRAPQWARDGVNAKEPGRDGEGWYADVATEAESKDGAPIGLFAEVGTKPHVIESHGDYPLRNAKTGQVFGKKVNHPGTEAQPHLRPALHEDL
ncbi:hypothetical protein ACFFX1_54990 [Dactylosporangium sucinum]|uniref:HK97 gp10 family phage protein n=1 Tax=Dactylosporangium sucinum TaxID=1424081 RepID=A0A917U2D7_9ACTN|nr:hypothetical protein [Dactylosporangium sucinum]GGM53276.1 hypothetical protein GCM10007977_063620 [Dactylosporangium sucinum]